MRVSIAGLPPFLVYITGTVFVFLLFLLFLLLFQLRPSYYRALLTRDKQAWYVSPPCNIHQGIFVTAGRRQARNSNVVIRRFMTELLHTVSNHYTLFVSEEFRGTYQHYQKERRYFLLHRRIIRWFINHWSGHIFFTHEFPVLLFKWLYQEVF